MEMFDASGEGEGNEEGMGNAAAMSNAERKGLIMELYLRFPPTGLLSLHQTALHYHIILLIV